MLAILPHYKIEAQIDYCANTFATFLPMNCQHNLYAFGVNKCPSTN